MFIQIKKILILEQFLLPWTALHKNAQKYLYCERSLDNSLILPVNFYTVFG